MELVSKSQWTGGKLTWNQKQYLLKKRKEYPANKGCEMLCFEDGLAICLVRQEFGIETADSACMSYPNGKLCKGQKNG